MVPQDQRGGREVRDACAQRDGPQRRRAVEEGHRPAGRRTEARSRRRYIGCERHRLAVDRRGRRGDDGRVGHIDRGPEPDSPDDVIREPIADEEVALPVRRYEPWSQFGGRSWPAVAGVAGRPVTGDGVDDPIGCHLANNVIARVGDEEVARTIHGQAAELRT